MSEVKIHEGPPLTRLWVRRVVSFGVWVALGFSPFLGKLAVPGFSPLLDLYPLDLRGWLIPVSSLLMGMMAVTVEFAESSGAVPRTLSRWFKRTVILFVVCFVALIAVYPFIVARVETSTGTYSFVTGALDVPRQPPGSECKCTEGMTADQCIEAVSLNAMNVRRCFGSQRVAVATLALALIYLLVTGAFAASVGLLVLYQRARARQKQDG